MNRREMLKTSAAILPSIALSGHVLAETTEQNSSAPSAPEPTGEHAPTTLFAQFVSDFPNHPLPDQTRRMARVLLLDTIGCAIAGTETRAGSIMASHVRSNSAPRMATLASGDQAEVMSTAMANCTMANALDYDAYGPTGHMATVVVPAALASAEAFDASGKTLLEAICLGMEIGGRIGGALRRPTTSTDPLTGHTFAIFGATAAAGHIIGLSFEQMLNAFGIAGYSAQLPTLRRFFSQPQDAMTKYDHLGLATRNGIDAALLAQAGFTGDRSILEGPQAFWRLSGAEGCDWNYLIDDLGTTWRMDETRPKAFPVGVGTVTMLEALEGLIARHHFQPAKVNRVVVRTTQSFVQKNLDVRTEIEAWTDLRYCVAAMLFGVKPYRAWYRPEIFLREDIKAFMQRVEIVQLPLTRADGSRRREWAAEVELYTNGGRFQGGRDDLSPMSDEAIDRKFRDNAQGILAAEATERTVALCHDIEQLASVRALGAALRAPHVGVRKTGES